VLLYLLTTKINVVSDEVILDITEYYLCYRKPKDSRFLKTLLAYHLRCFICVGVQSPNTNHLRCFTSIGVQYPNTSTTQLLVNQDLCPSCALQSSSANI
jgi:hypothetical protein